MTFNRNLLSVTLALTVSAPCFAADLALPGSAAPAATEAAKVDELTAAELFTTERVWTIHLRFTAEQFAAMEPAGGPPGFGGPGGPGGPAGGPGGPRPGGFGPGMFLALAFLRNGDTDADGKLSATEFQQLGTKWFEEWDREKTGKVDGDQLKTGLNRVFGPPAEGGPRPGDGDRPGRPPGNMLQGAEGKRNGLASALGVDFKYVSADLEFEGRQLENVAVRYKGNGTFMQSRGSLKRSLKIDLNKNVKGQRIGGATTLNLHSAVTDASWMNEVLAYRLYRDAGVPAPRTAYARVYLTVEGKYDRQYIGLYSLVEDVSGKSFEEAALGTTKGVLFKPVTPALFSDLGNDWSKYNQAYDPKETPTVKEAQRVIEFAQLVSNADDEEFAEKAPAYLDLEKFARYMAVTAWISTLDSILGPGQNFYMFLRKKGDRFEFIPWDLDHAFGQFPMIGSQEQRERLSIHKPWQGDNRFLERVFKLESFKTAYLKSLEEISAKLGTPERISGQVDALAKVIRPAVEEEGAEKLAGFDQAVSGAAPQQPAAAPGPFPFAPAKPIKGFVTARVESVKDQLAGKEGAIIERFGFGGPGGPGGPGRGPGGPGGFGPGNFIGASFLRIMDADKDGALGRAEFTDGFSQLFAKWSGGKPEGLLEADLRTGINTDLAPMPPGGPGATPRPPE